MMFICPSKLSRHRAVCDSESNGSFKGGGANTTKDLWQELEHFGLHLTSE